LVVVNRHRLRLKPPKRGPGDKTRDAFYTLILDWIDLHTYLPQPARTNTNTRRGSREYGHPAEWASDKAAHIAHILWSWHDMLAQYRNEHGPPRHTSETIRVVNAWKYLDPRFDQLCELVDAEAFTEIHDLHHAIRHTLGHTNPPQTLPVPCPGIDCGLRTLQRHIRPGNDTITCATCGYTVRDDQHGENYRWLIRVCLDTLIDAA
jgi:hypothetical protein